MDEEEGWTPNLDVLVGLLRPETRLVVINFPHNPTGAVATPEFLNSLYALLEERGIYLLSDEMYRFLTPDGGASPVPACQDYSRAVSLGGLSKAFGLPGLRLGWVVSQDKELLHRMSSLKDYTTICHSAPSEILGVIALENKEVILARKKELIRHNLKSLEVFLERHGREFQCVMPKGGSMCFPRIVAVDSTLAFCEKLVAETGIMLVPSAMFRFGDHHVRFGVGRKDFSEVLDMFSRYITSTST